LRRAFAKRGRKAAQGDTTVSIWCRRPTADDLLTGRYASVGRILFGNTIATLQALDEPIDLFIKDSDHHGDYEPREYEAVRGKLSPGAILIGDNIDVTTELAEFSRRKNRRFLYLPVRPKDHW
jgi:hypothetical protein